MAVGSGPGIIQNYNSATDEPINAASKPAKPNQIEIIWAPDWGHQHTDNQPPPGGQLPLPVQVWVGGKQAAPCSTAGARPGFPAIDNIYFTVPPDVPLGATFRCRSMRVGPGATPRVWHQLRWETVPGHV